MTAKGPNRDTDDKSALDPENLNYSELKPNGEAHSGQSWVVGYGLIAGVAATVFGAARCIMTGSPDLYIILVATSIALLWFTWFAGKGSNNMIKGADVGHAAMLWFFATIVVGLIAWLLLGPIVGAALMSLGNVHIILKALIALIMLFGATVLIIGVADRSKFMTVLGLIMFAVTTSFGAHFGTVEAETQQQQQEHFDLRDEQKKLGDTEKLKDACEGEDAGEFAEFDDVENCDDL